MANAGAGIANAGTRPSPADKSVRRMSGLRKNSLAISVMLLAQYGLGMGVNLYARVPRADQGRGLAVAVGRALSNPPAVLAIHAALGLLLLIAAVNVLSRAILARHRRAVAISAAGLLSIFGAAFSGASFADHGHPGESMAMAVLTAVALLCYLLNLFTLGTSPSTSRDHRPERRR
jgi:O-antigen/teichoic acid export membrane protein